MKTKKMSLANIQGKLSRTEMKNIMAGSGDGCQGLGKACDSIYHVNCFTGYVCATNKCQKPTMPTP